MANGDRIIDGLRGAIAHAHGEPTGAREHVTVPKARLAALEAVAEAARASLDQSAKYIDSGDIRMSESLWWPIKDALDALDRVRGGGSGAGGG